MTHSARAHAHIPRLYLVQYGLRGVQVCVSAGQCSVPGGSVNGRSSESQWPPMEYKCCHGMEAPPSFSAGHAPYLLLATG